MISFEDIKRNSKKVAATSALALSLCCVAYFEGERLQAYLDPVSIPTICYGSTSGVKLGQTKTPEECRALLTKELGQAFVVVDNAVTSHMSEGRRAALASFVYNVGAGKFRQSTLVRKLNAYDPTACDELSRWVYAGGKKLPGLVKRREIERQLCLTQ